MEHTSTWQVASHVCAVRPEDISDAALDQAAWCIVDLLGAAMAGVDQSAAAAARQFALRFWGPGLCSVWLDTGRLALPGAVFANAVAGSALDLDDGHRAAGGHPGAALVPAVLALAQDSRTSGRTALAALVIGYEVAIRAAAARHPGTLDTYSTGRWCGYGVTAARCWMEGRSPKVLAHALAISGIHAPLQSASAYSRFGHHTKEGIPWGTCTGLAAVDLAVSGFTGPLDIWDDSRYYRAEEITRDWGVAWQIQQTYFKPYACCRWLHAALDGWTVLVQKGLAAADVRQVEVHTFNRAIGLNNSPDPTSIEQAQFSLPFCLAVMALQGPDALLPISAGLLGRTELEEFARKVKLLPDARLEAEFPARAGARLVVYTSRETFTQEILHPKGDPANPLTEAQLRAKFQRLAAVPARPVDPRRVLEAAAGLKNTRIDPLLTALEPLAHA